MEGEMMSQAASTATFLGQYGTYGLLSILFLVVVHLYRQQTALAKEVRQTVEKYAAETARLQEQTLEELKRSREAVERNTEALSRLAPRT